MREVEQMTFVVSYVSMTQSETKIDIHINESFLGFLPLEMFTSKELSDVIIRYLDNVGLQLQDMRRRGYDNGANMRGDKSGCKLGLKI